jgi:Protein of unknown function (DUF3224)
VPPQPEGVSIAGRLALDRVEQLIDRPPDRFGSRDTLPLAERSQTVDLFFRKLDDRPHGIIMRRHHPTVNALDRLASMKRTMKTRNRLGILAALPLLLGASAPALSETPKPAPPAASQEKTMTMQASGPFEVKLNPQGPDEITKDTAVGRMSIDKQFHGDLEAVSKGQMLMAGTPVQGSAGYVAIEQVSGTLRGRKGTFVLQHTGIMNRGQPQLAIRVIPDSGTGDLAGLTGTMEIQIEGGKHWYTFEYSLPEK